MRKSLKTLLFWATTVTAAAGSGCATTTRSTAPPWTVTAGTDVRAVATEPAVPHGEAYTSQELGFELDRPAGQEWALATNVLSPDGRPIPVVVAHPATGAQIVVQVSEPVDRPEALATMLKEKLSDEKSLKIGEPMKIAIDSGGEAFGFEFGVKGEALGRVAVIEVGGQIILVVASWPEDADPSVVKAIDSVVKSVRAPATVNPAMLRPDKA